MPNRVLRMAIILIGIGLVISLSRSIFKLLQAADRLKLAEQELAQLEKEHQSLVEQKEYYQSEEFIEQEARNKLNMARPGEAVVVLPPNVGELLGETETKSVPETPNWKMWWELFF